VVGRLGFHFLELIQIAGLAWVPIGGGDNRI
jgi:hypothetical protein